jgi:hypothetical protein
VKTSEQQGLIETRKKETDDTFQFGVHTVLYRNKTAVGLAAYSFIHLFFHRTQTKLKFGTLVDCIASLVESVGSVPCIETW